MQQMILMAVLMVLHIIDGHFLYTIFGGYK